MSALTELEYPVTAVAREWMETKAASYKYDTKLTEYLDGNFDYASDSSGDTDSYVGYFSLFTFHTNNTPLMRDSKSTLAVIIRTNSNGLVGIYSAGDYSEVMCVYDHLCHLYHKWADNESE